VTRTLLVGLGAAAVLLAACSSPDETDFRDAATKAIEDGQSTNLAIPGLDAKCDEPASKDVGTTFACTATTPDGEQLNYTAEITDEDDPVRVYTTNYDRMARFLIEGAMAASMGVDALEATCEQPTSTEVGATFGCTAALPGGGTITVDAHIQPGGMVLVDPPTGVLRVEILPTIEAEAARVLSEQVGQTVPAEMIDCGSEPIVAHAGEPFVCALIDPTNPNVVYDAMITVDDLTNPTQFVVEIADTPRP
jgi:hypothetical protein